MTDLLAGIRVAEISNGIAAAYCGRLLADAGALVTRFLPEAGEEPVGAVTATPHLAEYLGQGKHVARTDLGEALGTAALRGILEQHDIVLHDGSLPHLAAYLLDRGHYAGTPVAVCLVTPFGFGGRYAGLCNDDLLLYALSGAASVTPEDAADRDVERPMQIWGHQAQFVGGLASMAAVLQAWFTVQSGGGAVLVDLAVLDVLRTIPISSLASAWVDGEPAPPPKQRPVTVPRGMLRCSDGYVYTQGGDDNWPAWAALAGRADWQSGAWLDPAYRGVPVRVAEIQQAIQAWLNGRSTWQVYRDCQAAGIVTFPVNRIEDVRRNPQLAQRDVFRPVESRSTIDISAPRTPIRLVESPRRMGEAGMRHATTNLTAARSLPLAGVRIADFSWVIAGPRCTAWLGALGAEVIKVESHNRPDRSRASTPYLGGAPSMDSSASFTMLNHSKRGCTINLGTREGRELAQRLAAECDVAIENFSTGAARKLGLVYEDLAEKHPALVMVSCSGLGRTGPDAGMRAFGKSIHAFSGLTYLTSWPGTPPRGPGTTWTDPLVGLTAVAAILAGLARVRRTGEGAYFDLSMAETTIALMCEAFLQVEAGIPVAPAGNASDEYRIHDTYRCADGHWVAITAHTGAEERALRHETGAPAGEQPPGCPGDAGDGNLRRWCLERPAAEVLQRLGRAGVCGASVRSFRELLYPAEGEEGLRYRTVSVDGVGAYPVIELPWRQEPEQGYVYTPAPRLGEDTDAVLRDVFGLDASAIAAARDNGSLT